MTNRPVTIQYVVKAVAALAMTAIVNGGFTAIPMAAAATSSETWRYADIADVFVAAPIILRAKIVSAIALKGPRVARSPVRHYVEADVTTLIRGPGAVPPRLAWLVDVVPDSRGKLPKLKKAEVILAALPVADRPGQIRLAARDAQLFWTPATEARVRAVVSAVATPGAPPAVTGITSAFHTAGTVTGEGETQIFLATATKAPVSITVLTRPGQPKQWAFAVGEIVDEAAGPPAPDTLAWYRLACSLPNALPDAAVAELTETDANAARQDYRFVVQALGTCPRTRGNAATGQDGPATPASAD